jgi:hypothetical protein
MKVGGLLKPSEMEAEDELWLDQELRTEFVTASSGHEPVKSMNDGLDGWSLYQF